MPKSFYGNTSPRLLGDFRRRAFDSSSFLFKLLQQLTKFILLVSLLIPALPGAWTEELYIGRFNALGTMWHVASAALVGVIASRTQKSWISIGGALGLLAMLLLALIYSADFGYKTDSLLSDTFVFAALPVGAAWASCISPVSRRKFMLLLYCANCFVLAAINILLVMHRLEPEGVKGARVMVYSEFASTWVLSVMTPYICFDDQQRSKSMLILSRIAVGANLMVLVITTVISGTRSVLIQLFVSMAFVIWALIRYRGVSIKSVLASAMAFIVVASFSVFVLNKANVSGGFSFDPSYVVDRMTATNVEENERSGELRVLFEEYGTALLLGKGLGSEFASITYSPKTQSNITTFPHIAIFTLLMKGGLLAFVFGIVIPLLWTLRTLFAAGTADLFASCAAVLMYFMFASISGGWTFPPLFLYGFFLANAVRLAHSPRSISGFRHASYQHHRNKRKLTGRDPSSNLRPEERLFKY